MDNLKDKVTKAVDAAREVANEAVRKTIISDTNLNRLVSEIFCFYYQHINDTLV